MDLQDKKRVFRLVIVCAIGIAVNVVGNLLSSRLHWNIFLDSVGTVLTSVFSGYVPGIIVGLFTNLIEGIYEPGAVYYAIINVCIAIAAYYFYNKSLLKRWFGYPGLILVLTLVGGGHGYFYSWIVNGLISGKLNPSGLFLERFAYDFADKALTVLILALALKLLPEGVLRWLKIEGWQQKPLSQAEAMSVQMNRNRKVSLRIKITLLLLGASVSIGVTAMVISTFLYKDYTIEEHINLAEGVTNIASAMIEADKVDSYMELGGESEDYRETEEKLYRIRDGYPNIQYIYVYKIMEDGCHVVFDLDTVELEGNVAGEIIPFDKSFSQYIPALLAGKPIDPIITNDTYGWLITVYKPLYDSEGVCRCYVAADISMNLVNEKIYTFLAKLASIFLGFVILIVASGLWISKYNIVFPINTMSFSASGFAYDDEKALGENVEKLRMLDIHTGDEIENMYQAFSKTTENNMRYANALHTKTETISRMQNALIMVLADMVESRDESTGDHVRKTAAYTRIIMEKMKELGYYTEQLTEQFMYDVEHSAPLHDIGKIQVSDTILNKNGKLTDEEFEIMKTHTTAGGRIIEQVIETVPDSQYLKAAKNLAEFHHEKWNGKGYPHGLSGEDIPLSARIMAVADVFDALVSERCYKKAFPFEQAMEIIRKDAGTHFDPKVADAFIKAGDEVRKIAEHFGSHRAKEDR